MAELLLVHGSCHGAWCWDRLAPELFMRGLPARAINLPGNGYDDTPASEVTLDSYAEAIVAALDEPTWLLGHSMGGFPITAAALKAPEKVAGLIYLCAYVPRPGMSLVQMRDLVGDAPLVDAIHVSDDGLTMTFDPEQVPGKFYHDVDPELVDWALPRLTPQPLLPQRTPIEDPSPALALPRHYIACAMDRAIPLALQRKLTEDWQGGEVVTLPSSHSPFLSMPGRLADTIARLVR